MCVMHGRGALEICLSEKGALAKKVWETLFYNNAKACTFAQHTLPLQRKIFPSFQSPHSQEMFLLVSETECISCRESQIELHE